MPRNILLQTNDSSDFIVKLCDFCYDPASLPFSPPSSSSLFFFPGEEREKKGDMFSFAVIALAMWFGLEVYFLFLFFFFHFCDN